MLAFFGPLLFMSCVLLALLVLYNICFLLIKKKKKLFVKDITYACISIIPFIVRQELIKKESLASSSLVLY